MKSHNFDLNMHTARLLMDEPFFAAISRRIDKRASTAIPTAGVTVNPETAQFEMLYNPDFFHKLKDEEKMAVLKHEFYHIIFQHVTDRMPEGVNVKMWNIATDLAINSHLSNLPEGGLIPGQPGTPFENLPKGKTAEWYMENMPSFSGKQEENKQSGEPKESDNNQDSPPSTNPQQGIPDSLDDHSGWGQCSQEIKDIAKERLKENIKKAAEEASQSRGWGSVSSSVQSRVMKIFETKVDWKKVLRYFVKTSQRADRSSSVKRINRRYAYIHPGRKTNRVARVAVSIDQSGSVDDGMLSKFFAELNKLSEIAEFVVIPFDTRVDESKVYTWKKGAKRSTERVLSGGTCFEAPTKFVNDKGFDGHIILTDLQAPKPSASKCQRMWMTTSDNMKYMPFSTKERIVIID